jgi:hypothetical protein
MLISKILWKFLRREIIFYSILYSFELLSLFDFIEIQSYCHILDYFFLSQISCVSYELGAKNLIYGQFDGTIIFPFTCTNRVPAHSASW